MKRFFTLLLAITLLMPSVMVHADIIVFTETELTHHKESDSHFLEHQHDANQSHENKEEHHHHCVDIHLHSTYIHTRNDIEAPTIFTGDTTSISFYKVSYYSSYLEEIFQPPKGLFIA